MELRYDNLFVFPGDPRIPYRDLKITPDIYRPNPILSNFFADLLFLTTFVHFSKSADLEKVEILYVFGNSPDQRLNPNQLAYITFLARLFPWYNFRVFSDTFSTSGIAKVENLVIETQAITSSFSSSSAGKKRVLMLVVRSSANWLDILKEQENLVTWVKPDIAYVLFKLPYSNEGVNEVEYYDGYLMKEIWGKRDTTETRLIFFPYSFSFASTDARERVSPRKTLVENKARKIYNVLEYEEMLAYHNKSRGEVAYSNPINEFSKFIDPTNDLRNDFDSRATIEILSLYLYKINKALINSTSVLKLFNTITEKLGTKLYNKLMLVKEVATSFTSGINDIGLEALEDIPSISTDTREGKVGVSPVPVVTTTGIQQLPAPTLPSPATLPLPKQVTIPGRGIPYTREELFGYNVSVLKNILGLSSTKLNKDQLVQKILNQNILKR